MAYGLRCRGCRKLLAERISAPYTVRCHRCGTTNSCDCAKSFEKTLEARSETGHNSNRKPGKQ